MTKNIKVNPIIQQDTVRDDIKIIRDGFVAIVLCRGRTGWYSRNRLHVGCLFDHRIVKLVWELERARVCEAGRLDSIVSEIQLVATALWGPRFDAAGAGELVVEWVKEGSMFCVGRERDIGGCEWLWSMGSREEYLQYMSTVRKNERVKLAGEIRRERVRG